MAEARKAPRSSTRQRGKVLLNGRTDVTCTIRDMSTLGARLNFTAPIFLPRSFQLQGEDFDQKVTVIWQAGVMAGVRFATPVRGLPATAKRRWPWSRK